MSKIETNVIKPQLSFFENEKTNEILTSQDETNLDSRIFDVENFMKNNNGKGKSESEKDELYKDAQNTWKSYAAYLRDVRYNFYLNRSQWKFLTDLIISKLEYDVNTVFFAIELTELLGNMKNVKYTNDTDLVAFPVNATEITYIYHLISPYKIKGLCKDAYTFSQVLRRIGDISKIFNYYDTSAKNLSTEIQNWVTAFDENVTIESPKTEDVVEAKVSKPKKKTEEA
jgi:hypothetical protein